MYKNIINSDYSTNTHYVRNTQLLCKIYRTITVSLSIHLRAICYDNEIVIIIAMP